jgi:3-deoxy-D-manno-octulosonate 8-phosphate phosphatase (KDO 8-P phosphatase)
MDRAAAVRLLALDCDGVLTDGSINLDDSGAEFKRFHVRDGFGLRLWREMGFHTAIITGRRGSAIEHRARELKISYVRQGADDKVASLAAIARELGLELNQTAFLADDWPDLRVMAACGYPMAVADAHERVREAAAYILTSPGGRGAVREAVEHLLGAQGLLGRALAMYDPGSSDQSTDGR